MRVRDFLQDIRGFRSVHLLFRDNNSRVGNWLARRDILNSHGKLIFLEEDCVCAQGFLPFINQGLEKHADDPKVFSIAGYSPPIPQLASMPLGRVRVPTFNPWGFGIWKDRDALVKQTLPAVEFNRLLGSREFKRKVMGSLGPRYFGMLRKAALSELPAYDLMAMLSVIQNDMVSIFPTLSFVRNTGFDGSGENCGETASYEVQTCGETAFDFAALPCSSSRTVDRGFSEFFGGGFRDRMKFLSKQLRGRARIPEA
jgi:hypothetical protein